MEVLEKQSNNRIFYMDFLRVISMLAVIILHTASIKINSTEIGGANLTWQVFNFFNSLTRWCVPIFIMISGILFLNPKKEITISNIYKKYIPRLLIILFVWNFLYAIFSCIIDHTFSVQTFISNMLLGPVHMWFLYMIIGLYMITPFLRKIAHDDKLLKYFLILWLVFSITTNIAQIVGLNIVTTIIEDKMIINFVIGYSGYFLLGYFLSNKDYKSNWAIILAIVCFVITFIGTSILSSGQTTTNQSLYSNLSPVTIGFSIAIFILGKNLYSKKDKINNKFRKIVNMLSKYSLGIYIIHYWFLNVLSKIGIDVLLLPPIINVIVISIITFLLSLLATFILSKIKYLNRLVL